MFSFPCLLITCVFQTNQLTSTIFVDFSVSLGPVITCLFTWCLLFECLFISTPCHDQKACPELCASLFSRLTYSWYTSLAQLGLTKSLTIEDIWPVRPADSVQHNFDLYKQASQKLKGKPLNILRIFWQCYSLDYMFITCLLVISRTLLVFTATATK